jgi:hypothetical protein
MLSNASGIPVRGNLSNTFVGKIYNPFVFLPKKGNYSVHKYVAESTANWQYDLPFPWFPYLHVCAIKDQIAAGCFLQFVYDLIIAGMIRSTGFPVTKRMRACRAHSKTKPICYFSDRL